MNIETPYQLQYGDSGETSSANQHDITPAPEYHRQSPFRYFTRSSRDPDCRGTFLRRHRIVNIISLRGLRKLAERSETAATEISTMPSRTIKAAHEAGKMLSRLVPDIKRTAELVAEIRAVCLVLYRHLLSSLGLTHGVDDQRDADFAKYQASRIFIEAHDSPFDGRAEHQVGNAATSLDLHNIEVVYPAGRLIKYQELAPCV